MINREALAYLVNLGEGQNPIIKLEKGTFSTKGLRRLTGPLAETLTVSTHTGLVDYKKANVDK